MGNVIERQEWRAGQALADPLRHVRTRDRIEHAPHEGERHVGSLQCGHPALAVDRAVADVASEAVGDRLATAGSMS